MRKCFSLLFCLIFTVIVGCSSTTTKQSAESKPNQPSETKNFKLPEGDINLFVPFAAGGGTDLTFRSLAENTKGIINKNIVIVNKPGSGGSVGLAEASRTKPNGLNLVVYTSDTLSLPILQSTSFTANDFKPVIMVNFDPACIVVPANSPYQTIETFIEAAKTKKITVGNSGFGNIWHISSSALEEKAGIKLNHVPFDGSAPTVTAALGGHIDAFVASPPEVAPQVEAGKLKILAIMADERINKFPDVPTLKEKNLNISIGTWRGLGVPKDTPDEAIQILHDALAKGVKSDGFQKIMGERGMGIKYMDTSSFTKFVAEEKPKFEELAKKIKASAPTK